MELKFVDAVRLIALIYSPDIPSQLTQVNELIRSANKQFRPLLRSNMSYEYNEQKKLMTAMNTLNQTEQYEYDNESHQIIC